MAAVDDEATWNSPRWSEERNYVPIGLRTPRLYANTPVRGQAVSGETCFSSRRDGDPLREVAGPGQRLRDRRARPAALGADGGEGAAAVRPALRRRRGRRAGARASRRAPLRRPPPDLQPG